MPRRVARTTSAGVMPCSTALLVATKVMQQLEAGVEAIQTSEDFKRYLRTAATFHQYSPNNVLLILAQKPEATRVAGYKTWQSLGRQVKKGEKAIYIFAPRSLPLKDLVVLTTIPEPFLGVYEDLRRVLHLATSHVGMPQTARMLLVPQQDGQSGRTAATRRSRTADRSPCSPVLRQASQVSRPARLAPALAAWDHSPHTCLRS